MVSGIINKVSQGDLLSNPLKFDQLVLTAAQSLTIDKTIDLKTLGGAEHLAIKRRETAFR